ncbi:GIY-YIG nuclease family protein [Gorillibacterium sp. sgz5001074]|uniref:GIY-YIG nuclease family protein n=1 Tax=Gorillibacterium sp. sgz5001074 TaxID=3446695 RepID=UPI003F67FA65
MTLPPVLAGKLRSLPQSPGVYLMKDGAGNIIYVGKSKNLKNRVSSYFHDTKSHTPKTKRLVGHIRDLELRLTDTEFEAFMLECQLIKEYKPMYNRKMKMPQSYTYIALELSQGLRAVAAAAAPGEREDTLYYGPYTSRRTVERAIHSIQEHHRILCSSPASAQRACLNHAIGLCRGMCLGGQAWEDYRAIMEQIAAFLDGGDSGLLEEMERSMQDAAETLDFEKAAKLRDAIGTVSFLRHREQVIRFTEESHRVAVVEELQEGILKLFLIQRNRILHREKLDSADLLPSGVHAAVKHAIRSVFRAEARLPEREITRDEVDEAQIIHSYLNGGSCRHLVLAAEWLFADGDHPDLDAALHSLLDVPPHGP